MSLKRTLKKLVEQLIGVKIYRVLPRGVDFAQDIANALPAYRAEVIFDVGANVGQSAKIFLPSFPDSHIHCFEPVNDTFSKLKSNFEGNDRVDCYRLAFGSSKSTGKMVLQGSSEMFFLLGQSNELPESKNAPTESVDILTLDEFCLAKGIDHISYLKIDTEGADLEVLKGAVNLLSEKRIDLVQLEAGMNSTNSRHVPLESLSVFLESHGYFLFGIYEQVNEWPSGEPHLRRTNPVYISREMIEKYRKPTKSNE